MSKKLDDRFYWLALNFVAGIGPRHFLNLIDIFETPREVFQADRSLLERVRGIPKKAVENILARHFEKDPEKELKRLSEAGIQLICLKDEVYPKNLGLIHDPPPVIFVKGSLAITDVLSVAVVGSRSASYQGKRYAQKLCRDLAHQGITIVSGFARGIDTAAHTGSLDGGGRTLAVLGCGLDINYPRQNRELRKRIIRSGALITEFPLGVPPEGKNFPARNRLISGLSLGVIVVEAGRRSGSLITARLALEQDREVFAVPGAVTDYRSLGPHWLIKQGAKLVERAEDVLEELAPMLNKPTAGKDSATTGSLFSQFGHSLSDTEKDILHLLDAEPMVLDDMGRALNMEIGALAGILSKMEIKGLVKQLPGKYFCCS